MNVSEPLDSPLPCTPNGVIELVKRHGIDWNGKNVVVLGRGITVGRPLGLLLTRREVNATATLAHTGTQNLDEVLREADVIVAAVGVPHVLKAHQVKEGAILLDVGVSRAEDPETGKKKLFGDVSPVMGVPESRRCGPDDPRRVAGECGGDRGASGRVGPPWYLHQSIAKGRSPGHCDPRHRPFRVPCVASCLSDEGNTATGAVRRSNGWRGTGSRRIRPVFLPWCNRWRRP